MSSSRSSVQRRLITPSSWGKKGATPADLPAPKRTCTHCGHKGLTEEQTIAGNMYRCPSCKKLQF